MVPRHLPARLVEVGGGLRRNVERDALTVKGDLSKRISLSMTQPAPHCVLTSTTFSRLPDARLGFAAHPAMLSWETLEAKRLAPFDDTASRRGNRHSGAGA
jgi:hypothetical protein